MSRRRKRPSRRRRLQPPVDPAIQEAYEWTLAGLKTPITPGSPRRHHYVPQFLLQRFAADDRLVRLPLRDSDGSESATHIKNLAVIRDFYTFTTDDVGDTVVIEEGLARLDSDASIVVDRLLGAASLPPSRADRAKLTTWLTLLFYRGPKVRRMMEACDSFIVKTMLNLEFPDKRSELQGQWEASRNQNAHLKEMLHLVDETAPLLMHRRWTLFRLSEPGLVLPDTPVVMTSSSDPSFGTGVATAQELLVPLDRRTVLVVHNDEAIGDQIVEVEGSSPLDDFNRMLVGGAYEEVYCHPDDHERVLLIVQEPRDDVPLFFAGGAPSNGIEADGVNMPPRRRRPRRHRRKRNHGAG